MWESFFYFQSTCLYLNLKITKTRSQMKKLLLTGMVMGMALGLNAQNRPAPIGTVKERLQRMNNLRTVPYQPAISGNELPANKINGTVANQGSSHKSSQVQTVVGNSTYDLQTNGSVQNRIYNKNGTLGASWTFSTDLAGTYPDRGTGYNFNSGSGWGPLPTARIETDRRGWPSLVQMDNGSEVIVSHQSLANPTATNLRSTAGTGSWTQTNCTSFPNGENTLWARMVAGGPSGNTLHMIDISYPTGNQGTIVNGLDGCLTYSRSQDGGLTWDINRVQPPGSDSTIYSGFRADGYAIDASGSTIAFTAGEIDEDWAVWKSSDNGDNWTKTIIYDFPFTHYDDANEITDVDGDGVADTVLSTDGSYAILIDNNGMVHAWAGAMFILDDDPTALLGLFLSTDGLLYWNESFGSNPPVVVAQAPDLDGSGQADAFAVDLGGRYGNDGICSMPSVGIDAAGNIYMSYCPLIEGTDSGNPSPLAFSYRNVYLVASMDGGTTWGTPINVSNSNFDEAVFCSMAKNVDNCVHLLWQQDGAPGYSVPPNGEHAIGNNDFIYDCVDPALVLGVSDNNLNKDVTLSVYPNPASSMVYLNYNALGTYEIKVEIRNVMGQIVESIIRTISASGNNNFGIDVSKYSSGVYTINTLIGNEVYASKFVKN
jgi:hypothetical protein